MYRNSIYYPNDVKSAVVVAVVVLFVLLHMSELLGLTDSTTILFGWIPIQFAYDVAYTLAGVVLLYGMYRISPDPPEEYREESGSMDGEPEPTTTGLSSRGGSE